MREFVRLTEMPMQAALPPEAQESALKKHEGKAIMVTGHYSRDWIYSAEVIDRAWPQSKSVSLGTEIFEGPSPF